jgi:hypothetical protein
MNARARRAFWSGENRSAGNRRRRSPFTEADRHADGPREAGEHRSARRQSRGGGRSHRAGADDAPATLARAAHTWLKEAVDAQVPSAMPCRTGHSPGITIADVERRKQTLIAGSSGKTRIGCQHSVAHWKRLRARQITGFTGARIKADAPSKKPMENPAKRSVDAANRENNERNQPLEDREALVPAAARSSGSAPSAWHHPSCRFPHDLSPAPRSGRGTAGAATAYASCLVRFEPTGQLMRLKNGAKRTSKERVE